MALRETSYSQAGKQARGSQESTSVHVWPFTGWVFSHLITIVSAFSPALPLLLLPLSVYLSLRRLFPLSASLFSTPHSPCSPATRAPPGPLVPDTLRPQPKLVAFFGKANQHSGPFIGSLGVDTKCGTTVGLRCVLTWYSLCGRSIGSPCSS